MYKDYKRQITQWINKGYDHATSYKDDFLKIRMEHGDFTIADKEWWLMVNGDGSVFVELLKEEK